MLLPSLGAQAARDGYASTCSGQRVLAWPSPLVIPAFPGLPAPITASTNMVGVRMSAHPVAQAIVAGLGEPLVATSANQSGQMAASSVADCDAAGLTGVDGIVEAEPVSGTAAPWWASLMET